MIVPYRASAVHYPDSDGQPMADNTLQFDWIAILKWNAEAYFANRADVFVAGDHLIYPVEGDPSIRQAPDVYVAFGRPKGYRGSYLVWEEGGIFPQVIIEVWSPNNRYLLMQKKFAFYERYGAEEYYIVYPEFPAYVEGWLRREGRLVEVETMSGHVSPRLGFRFAVERGELRVYGPDGRLLRRPDEIAQELAEQRHRAEQEAQRAEQEARRAAEAMAERDAERARAERLAAKLRALGLDPDAP
ncbi:MAG: Uma2 family endonuclease [Gemmataceae bacterium]|nr:Uma2 family endonuclease [Gemmata sp.]MDW8198472.1 Uma2 family endonuclease [Gemmataceae bacterium]